AGELHQPAAVVPRLDYLRPQLQAVPVLVPLDLDLFDVEAELVQAVQPLVEAVTLVGTERLLFGERRPEPVVTESDVVRERLRVDELAADFCRKVVQLDYDVHLRAVEVMRLLAVGELLVQLAGFRVYEVRRESSCVEA